MTKSRCTPAIVVGTILTVCGVLLTPVRPALADVTINVATTTDGVPGSLRAAIGAANAAGEPVTIVLGASATYELTICGVPEEANASGDLDLAAPIGVTIDGNGSTIRQTCPDTRVFEHHGPGGLDVDSLVLTGADLSAATFPDNHTEVAGLGLRSVASLRASHLTVTGNVGKGPERRGPAVFVGGDFASFDLTSISSNNAAGIFHDGAASSEWLVTRSTISDNAGWNLTPHGELGGRESSAITVRAGRLNIADTTIERNTSARTPVPPPVWPPIATGSANVGALSMPFDTATTKLHGARLVIRNNTAFRGTVYGGKIELSDSLIEHNWTGVAGGVNGYMDLRRVTIRNNIAPLGAGGVVGYGLVEDSTITGNTAMYIHETSGHGGGVIVNGPLTIRRTTITANSARHSGGITVPSAYSDNPLNLPSELNLVDSTVADNTSLTRPDGPHEVELLSGTPAPTTSFTRSVISHTGPGAACGRQAGSSTSGGFNIVSDHSCFTSSMASDLTGTPASLRPLADNGGPTETRLPAPGSPIVDRVPTGTPGCAGADQRGIARPQGPGCDVGAVEVVKSGYHPMPPIRILDTRTGQGTAAQKFGPGESRSFALPPEIQSRATAVVVNVTAANPTASSHLTLWPTAQTRPLASNLNFPAHQNIAGLATIATGTGAQPVSVFNTAGMTDVVVDLAGWYDDGVDDDATAMTSAPADLCPCGDGFTAMTPRRILDTRPGSTAGGPATPFGPGETRTLRVAGVNGIAAGATAAVINLTVTNPTTASHLTAWPSGTNEPTVSNVNWPAGDTRANLAIVRLGPDGALHIRNNQGHVDVVGDVAGVFLSGTGARFTVLTPLRILDTRTTSNPLGQGVTRTVDAPAIPDGATAAVVNLTGVSPSAGTHITAWPTNTALPITSNLNLPAGDTRANLAVTRVDGTARFNLRNNSGTTHVVADLAGYFG